MKNLFGRKIKNLSSIVGIILMLLSFSALVSAECTCSCMITNCETGACQSEIEGNSPADCIRCVAECCAENMRWTCPPINP